MYTVAILKPTTAGLFERELKGEAQDIFDEARETASLTDTVVLLTVFGGSQARHYRVTPDGRTRRVEGHIWA